jgi:WD40 repeat protein
LLLSSDSGGRLKVWDEESGELHRELDDLGGYTSDALASFLSADGQQARLLAGSQSGGLVVYDPEAGSVLHRLKGHTRGINDLACIASSSAAPHHTRLVSASDDGTVKVWDGETGERLADLRGHSEVWSVAVWKEHTGEGEHDRIATAGHDREVKVWDGEAFALLHDLDCGRSRIGRLLPYQAPEEPYRLLVAFSDDRGLQVWDPEEGRLLHDGIRRGCPVDSLHLFESAQGRHLLAIATRGERHPRHPGDTLRPFLDVWDLGEAPVPEGRVRPAHKHG